MLKSTYIIEGYYEDYFKKYASLKRIVLNELVEKINYNRKEIINEHVDEINISNYILDYNRLKECKCCKKDITNVIQDYDLTFDYKILTEEIIIDFENLCNECIEEENNRY